GTLAEPFTVRTLEGEFSYEPGALRGPLIIHTYTNRSGFLECLWTSEASLRSLVEDLPSSTQLLFLSLDDSALSDVTWMREQVQRVAGAHSKEEVLTRLHFVPVPVFSLGNWIPFVLYSWSCVSRSCGLAQAVFTSDEWKMPIISKRLNARYDWLKTQWSRKSCQLVEAGDGCGPAPPSVAGAVAWVSEGNCSFFTKVQNMATSKASGVLVYTLAGSIQEMNCVEDECNTTLEIPASMVHPEPSVVQALQSGHLVYVSFQNTPSPNTFFAIHQQGVLAEMGLFLYPSFSFVNWQAQWFDFYADLQARLQSPAKVVPVFDKAKMQGKNGAVATVDMPQGLSDFTVLQLDASLMCPGRRDLSCAHWDRTVQLFVCCDPLGPYCNVELGRWITAFRRGTGRWLMDVSPLLPLLDGQKCTLTMRTDPWSMLWLVSLNLRFSVHDPKSDGGEVLRPFRVMPLYSGGTFDRNYNKRLEPVRFSVPAPAQKVELYAVITAHGSDDRSCGEFCVTSHHFLLNGVFNNTLMFDSAGSPLGCTTQVKEGAVPNEYGTWLYGRGGWCDGLQVDPWRVDVTKQLNMSEPNSIIYFGLFEGRDPNPSKDPGYIIMSSFLVFYK
uniref:Si:dkey-256h2.1 n=1 Tax=Tetraodon nigroviridis TaxID=99883 RepID=H3C439_TETNG